MRLFWEIAERLDRGTFTAKQKWEEARKQPLFRQQMEDAVEKVRPPQRAITFDE